MIVVTRLSIYIKIMRIDSGVFENEECKIFFYKSQNWYTGKS